MTTQMTPAITRALAYAQGELKALTDLTAPDDVTERERGQATLSTAIANMLRDDVSEETIIDSMISAARLSLCACRLVVRLRAIVDE